MNRRRIWCETSDLASLTDETTLSLLRERSIELIAAIFPGTEAEVPALLERCARAGVQVALWPMLDDTDGRWANALTMPSYVAMIRRLLAQPGAAKPTTIFVDLEPPIAFLRAALRSPREAFRWLPLPGFEEAQTLLRAAAEDAQRRGVPLSAAVLPLILLGGRASVGWQRALGIPVDGIPWESVQVMMYSSLFEGYSQGWIRPTTSEGLITLAARRTRERFGPRGGLSLGVVAPGALGDEQPMAGPGTLRRDVAVALAQGVRDLALFDLSGVFRRPSATAWLDAFCGETSQNIPPSVPFFSRAVGALGWGTGELLNAVVSRRIRLDSRACKSDSPPNWPSRARISRQPSQMTGWPSTGSFNSGARHRF